MILPSLIGNENELDNYEHNHQEFVLNLEDIMIY